MTLRWTPLLGSFETNNDSLRFRGKKVDWTDPQGATHDDGASVGLVLCDKPFSGGSISAKVTFQTIDQRSSAGVVVWSEPATDSHAKAAVGRRGGALFEVSYWDGKKTTPYPNGQAGSRENLLAGHEYELLVNVKGSEVTFAVDGVDLIKTEIQGGVSRSSPGLWCFSQGDISVRDFHISTERPTAFLVMQFTPKFNYLYSELIAPICSELGISAIRADDEYGPGLIIADITRRIKESAMVIAEITPTNANVYYEVGYAHALLKPTILIAEKGTALPFDVSPFRVLMYEDTIEGKASFEAGLRRHLAAILSQPRPQS